MFRAQWPYTAFGRSANTTLTHSLAHRLAFLSMFNGNKLLLIFRPHPKRSFAQRNQLVMPIKCLTLSELIAFTAATHARILRHIGGYSKKMMMLTPRSREVHNPVKKNIAVYLLSNVQLILVLYIKYEFLQRFTPMIVTIQCGYNALGVLRQWD